MKLKEAMIIWDPVEEGGKVRVVRLGTPADYSCSSGAAYLKVRGLTGKDAWLYLLLEAQYLHLTWGLDPRKVDAAFDEIEEYREAKAKHVELLGLP